MMNSTKRVSEKDEQNETWVFSKQEIAAGVAILVILILLSFCGNLCAMFIFSRKLGLREPTSISTFFLSLCDILMAVLVMPFSLISMANGKWSSSPAACNFHAYIFTFLLGASFVTMALTAIIRYLCVVKPSIHHNLKPRVTFLTISVMWATTLILTLIPISLGLAHGRYRRKRVYCQLDYSNETVYKDIHIFYLTVVALLALVILVAYYRVFCFVYQHNQFVTSNLQGASGSIEEATVTRTVATVVFWLGLCWAVTGIIEIRNIPEDRRLFKVPGYIIFLQTMLMYCSSAMNPDIYCFTSRRFRKELFEIYRRLRPSSAKIWPI